VDIAKESADMILLENSLLVLEEGVLEGRKVFANTARFRRADRSRRDVSSAWLVPDTCLLIPLSNLILRAAPAVLPQLAAAVQPVRIEPGQS
jgi:hypothetical protein